MREKLSSTTLPWYGAPRPSGDVALPACVHTALAARARTEPERALLVDADAFVTQRELVARVDARARALLARCGGPGRTVAVALAPGIESVVSYFACLAAGLRYLPMPADAPTAERVLAAVAPRLLVTDGAHEFTHDVETLRADACDATPAGGIELPAPDPRRIAHVLPTSGTATGTPKAVLTDHVGSMLSHAWRTRLTADDAARDVVGCNVFGVWDVVPALLGGIPLVMLDDATLRDPALLAAAIVRYGITRLMLTPTLLDASLAGTEGIDALARLRTIVLCGEPVTAALVARAASTIADVRLVNLYSLSECHDVAAGRLTAGQRVTSGQVADFAEVHVTEPDDRTRLVAAGEPGRVLVGGAALATGYLDAELTAERFFEARFEAGVHGRVYDTGDLGVLHADGTLEIRGRIDAALKVRGAWAEPEHIAAVLREHPRVAHAAVVASGTARGHAQLTAFVVASESGGEDLENALRRYVRARVAAPSVPARFVELDALPLAASGKVDTRRLREIELDTRAADADTRRGPRARPGEPAQPATGAKRHGGSRAGNGDVLERAVLDAFRLVLERPDAAARDDLDALGADSLARIELAAEIERVTGRRVRVSELDDEASAASIARRLDASIPARARAAWQLPQIAPAIPAAPMRPRPRGGRVLVTGATGGLGRALVARLLESGTDVTALVRAPDPARARARLAAQLHTDVGAARLRVIAGDLAQPRLGLAEGAHAELAAATRAIVHAGADIDAFADYAALEPVNVGGTRRVLELAGAAGAHCVHVSSSAALPLGTNAAWDETRHGTAFADTIAPRLARSDGYSRTKLAAEALAWRARDLGLGVTVVRVPHLVGSSVASRLTDTLAVLAAVRVVPEGGWTWQLAPVDAICARLEALLEAGPRAPLVHLATRPLSARDVAAALAARVADLRVLSVPAVVTVLAAARARRAHVDRRLASLDGLVREHGPRAAMSLADPELAADTPLPGAPAALLEGLVASMENPRK